MEDILEKKKNKILKILFILLIIFGTVTLGLSGYLLKDMIFNNRKENTNSNQKYSVVVDDFFYNNELNYRTEMIQVYEDGVHSGAYVIIYDENNNVLYNGSENNLLFNNYYDLYNSDDGGLIIMDYSEQPAFFKIYKFSGKKLELLISKEFDKDDLISDYLVFHPIEKNNKIEAFVFNNNLIYLVNQNKLLNYKGDGYLTGDDFLSASGVRIYNGGQKGQIINIVEDNEDYSKSKYGLYDIYSNKILIDTKYEALINIEKNLYVAQKDGKSGIINDKEKIILNFDYDFIEPHGDYYIVCKNNKLAIMDKKYKLITGFDFDYNHTYEYRIDFLDINYFTSFKYNDKIFLSFYDFDNSYGTYIINKDGSYQFLDSNQYYLDIFDYSEYDDKYIMKKEKNYTSVLNYDMKEMTRIQTTEKIYVLNKNTVIYIKDDKPHFIDFKSGNEIYKPNDYVYKDLTFKYDLSQSTEEWENLNNGYYDISVYANGEFLCKIERKYITNFIGGNTISSTIEVKENKNGCYYVDNSKLICKEK